jgi:hypothetical protein
MIFLLYELFVLIHSVLFMLLHSFFCLSQPHNSVDVDDVPKAATEWNTPAWTRGLIVKPDPEHVKGQVRLWGIKTLLGAALPPVQDYLGRFVAHLRCSAHLSGHAQRRAGGWRHGHVIQLW